MSDWKTTLELTDGVVSLRPFRLEDAPAHLAGEDDEQIRWLGCGRASTLESVRAWIIRNEYDWEVGGPVSCFALWSVQHKALGGFVEANTDVERIAGINAGDANVSYGVYPRMRGRGYASRAVRLVEEFLKERRIRRAVIRVDPANISLLKIPQRLGYQLTGSTTEDGRTLDVYIKTLTSRHE